MVSRSPTNAPTPNSRLLAIFILMAVAVISIATISSFQGAYYHTAHQRAIDSVNGRDGFAREEDDGFVVADLNGGGIPILDQSLQDLVECQRLRKLTAYKTLVSDVGLKFLHGHRDLRILHLDDCVGITDKSIPELSKLQQIMELSLTGTSVSETGLRALREALPNCRINPRSHGLAKDEPEKNEAEN